MPAPQVFLSSPGSYKSINLNALTQCCSLWMLEGSPCSSPLPQLPFSISVCDKAVLDQNRDLVLLDTERYPTGKGKKCGKLNWVFPGLTAAVHSTAGSKAFGSQFLKFALRSPSTGCINQQKLCTDKTDGKLKARMTWPS